MGFFFENSMFYLYLHQSSGLLLYTVRLTEIEIFDSSFEDIGDFNVRFELENLTSCGLVYGLSGVRLWRGIM